MLIPEEKAHRTQNGDDVLFVYYAIRSKGFYHKNDNLALFLRRLCADRKRVLTRYVL